MEIPTHQDLIENRDPFVFHSKLIKLRCNANQSHGAMQYIGEVVDMCEGIKQICEKVAPPKTELQIPGASLTVLREILISPWKVNYDWAN